jgi:hypothetical protein
MHDRIQGAEEKRFQAEREERLSNTARGVNIPDMSQAELRKAREGSVDLFKAIINPMTKEFQPKEDDWDDWEAFEGPSEEVMYFIMKALRRKPETMYGQMKINPQIQKPRAEQSEILFTKEEIQRRLVKVKSTPEQLDEYQGTVRQNEKDRGSLSRNLINSTNLLRQMQKEKPLKKAVLTRSGTN